MSTIFSDVPPIPYEGPATDNPLAFRHYDRHRIVAGRTLEEQLRPAVCYWHSFAWPGSDVFGAGTLPRPWLGGPQDQAAAERKLDAAFDFFERLGTPFFTFHDVDVMAPAETLAEHRANFLSILDAVERRMATSPVRLLWGTANLFGHPRYMAGAATNPDPAVFAFAAAQVRLALEATHRLHGANYVLWGGREGYDTLLNTDLRQERTQMGRFLARVVDHKHRIGFTGTILIEPKPFEPTKHQYERDVATVYGFLREFGLETEVKVNIEANHATLAGLSFAHEVATAQALGLFGSIDANRGDPQNGWDTDQFPNDVADLVPALVSLLEHGGFTTGGFNFDAKLRRQSIAPDDLFHAHIGGLDTLARATIVAAALIEDGRLAAFRADRYAGWADVPWPDTASLADIADWAERAALAPTPRSGRQERLENLVNDYLIRS